MLHFLNMDNRLVISPISSWCWCHVAGPTGRWEALIGVNLIQSAFFPSWIPSTLNGSMGKGRAVSRNLNGRLMKWIGLVTWLQQGGENGRRGRGRRYGCHGDQCGWLPRATDRIWRVSKRRTTGENEAPAHWPISALLRYRRCRRAAPRSPAGLETCQSAAIFCHFLPVRLRPPTRKWCQNVATDGSDHAQISQWDYCRY